MRIAALISIAALFLAGCATAPPLPRIESSRGDRIGVLVEAGDSPVHAHVGTTMFNNFSKQHSYDWKLQASVTRIIEQSVSKAGLTPVDLRAERVSYSDVAGLIQSQGDKWQIAPGKEEVLRRLREQLRLKAVVIVKEARVLAVLECAGGPCSELYMDRSGLMTRSFFDIDLYRAVAAYQWNVYVLDPVADIAKAEPLVSTLRAPSTILRGFKKPADFKNLSEAEMAPVREAILRFAEGVSSQAIQSLNPK